MKSIFLEDSIFILSGVSVQICTNWYLIDLNILFYLTSDLLPPILISHNFFFFYSYLLKQILRFFSQKDSGYLIFLNSSIPIPKKGNVKECSNYHTITLISHASKVMLKIL